MLHMRTTVTIEADVEQKLRKLMTRNHYTFKQALNETLRRGLAPHTSKDSKPFEIKTRPLGLKSGMDLIRLNELAHELGVEAFLEKEEKLARRLAESKQGK